MKEPGSRQDKPAKPAVSNSDIADLFAELADLLDIEGSNAFRVRAYRYAAELVRGHPKSMTELLAAGRDLSELPGIGKDLASKIATIVETGRLPLLEEVARRTPRVLSELMKIEGLGPKRVKTLYQVLNVRSVDDLERAAAAGRVRELPGFGAKTEQLILEGVRRLARGAGRLKLSAAEEIAEPLAAYLRGCDGVKQVTVAGSYRRRKETVGDLDFVVTAKRGADVMRHFTTYDQVADIVSRGETRSTVRLRSGLQVDLRLVPQASYGAALHYFTGSKAHNIAVRTLGLRRGYKINEYGVFEKDKRIAGRSEKSVYAAVGLPYIEPELREDHGEIEAARRGRLPELIAVGDLRGDLHCHTDASDGHATLEEMAAAAAELGYEYVSVNDHSKHVTIANGLDGKRLLAQLEAIDRLNARLDGLTVLKSAEVDILEDGTLDFPDDVLKELDFTVCSVHYQFGLPESKQTERILRAMDNPYFSILGHPSGRLIGERDAYAVNLERIIMAAKDRGVHLEVNSHPSRLDLNDEGCRLAKALGVKLVISTDAHSTAGLGSIRFGVDQARRGWLTADDVVNTRGLDELEALLR
jgi:DNA polymerase (family 10)